MAQPTTTTDTRFPPGFVWGAATSAYQVEGAVHEGGRGPSIWDVFSRTPGKVAGGDTGDVAADHYHRYREDAALMADLGLRAYRFSIAWPRIQPLGHGPANQAGLDFYRRLVDRLLELGIEPWVTLYHWDLPQALQNWGGWANREVVGRFADYAAVVYGALHDRVRHWTTLNEPWCSAFLGHAAGTHAPGIQDPDMAVRAVHHLLLAHGAATQAMRALAAGPRLGITLNLDPVSPASTAPEDLEAATRIDGLYNRLFLDPLFRGRYPADVLEALQGIGGLERVEESELKAIAVPVDLLGVNYYRRWAVAARPGRPRFGGPPRPWIGAGDIEFVQRGRPTTALGWEIDASGLDELLLRLDRDYPRLPLFVTENGAAFEDGVDREGRVRDDARVRFLDEHLRAALRAIQGGVDLRGFFVWSLLDNFEWAEGYAKRFGIVYVDFPTQRRVPKDSAHWYRDAIARGGLDGRPDRGVRRARG
jgi:beta-glucosidase